MKKSLLFVFLLVFSAGLLRAEKYEVSNALEFLQAIGSNRTIVLGPGEYDLSSVSDQYGEFYSFLEAFDGMELEIRGISGLTIEGSGNWESHLLTRPRYGHVIRFRGCQGIRLSNFKAGHGPESGYCTGGVLHFDGCQDISIENCQLYGSGTEGLTMSGCNKVKVKNSIIKSCTYSIMTLRGCMDVSFTDCKFFDNQEFELVNISACNGVAYKKCSFSRNRTSYMFFQVAETDGFKLKKCSFDNNKAANLAASSKILPSKGLTFSGNQWSDGKYRDGE